MGHRWGSRFGDAENGGGALLIASPGEKIVDPEEYTNMAYEIVSFNDSKRFFTLP